MRIATLRRWPSPRRRLLALTAIWLTLAAATFSTVYAQPSRTHGDAARAAQADALATLPADTLARWCVDLTWLVEDLKADAARAAVLHTLEVDTLQRRVDFMALSLQMAKDRQPGWLARTWAEFRVGLAFLLGAAAGVWAAQ